MDIGVIGVGMMGRNHARIYSELKSVGFFQRFINATGIGRGDKNGHEVV